MSHLDVREQSSREQQPEPAPFVPPASPEGQRWLASAIGNRAFSEAVVARTQKRSDVTFEDETVHGDAWFDGVESRMFDVETRLGANAANYGVLVLQACEHFGALADGQGREHRGRDHRRAVRGGTRRRGRWRWSSAS